jgi:hypothetical protein
MIDQTFLDVAVPLVRDRLRSMGLDPASVPVVIDDSWRLDMLGALAATEFSPITHRAIAVTVKARDQWAPYFAEGMRISFGLPGYDEITFATAVLTHELIHTSLPHGESHGPTFTAALRKAGLVGPATQSIPGPELARWVDSVVKPEYEKARNNGE